MIAPLRHGEVGGNWELERQHASISLAEAEATAKAVLGGDVPTVTELDLEDELRTYELLGGCNRASFATWLSVRDYVEAGYLSINRLLDDGAVRTNEDHAVLTKALNLERALKRLSLRIRDDQRHRPRLQLYRGEPRSRADVIPLVEALDRARLDGELTAPWGNRFVSTTSNESVLDNFQFDFKSNPQEQAQSINVVYKISRDDTNSGVDLQYLLRNQESEVLFLPGTRVAVEGIQGNPRSDDCVCINVKVETLSEQDFTARLASSPIEHMRQ